MLNNFKLKHAINLFLIVCVLSSNHIIIYNEELLVALSFFSFVIFIGRYFGNNIKESLDSNGLAIREICENLTNSKEEYLRQLCGQLERCVKYKSIFSGLKSATLAQLSKKGSLRHRLQSHFYRQTIVQCTTLLESRQQLQPLLVDLMAKNQLDRVLTKHGKSGASAARVDRKLLKSVLGVMTNK